ncbi:hypothetical protein LZ016_12805 [Sphingomonas sp. SM33]|uniref:Lipoprotein n=1 Tax=Sphingomonas telluris TaxID=2907998 RepID=A0ABS9VPT3_9SPHN|nr:hypothetical protein [Sphingomonas telluris]MCH8616973.1 hypothetical protein [Sphingomonas telluris]
MKTTPIFVAAAGFAMVGACTVKSEDNSAAAENMESAPTMTANESVLPGTDNQAGTDTLGNQLDQLNESDAESANAADDSSNSQ